MIGEKIRSFRLKMDYTQGEIAREINIPKSMISAWETGKIKPNKEDLEMLSEVFEVDVNELKVDNSKRTRIIHVKKKKTFKKAALCLGIAGYLLFVIALASSISAYTMYNCYNDLKIYDELGNIEIKFLVCFIVELSLAGIGIILLIIRYCLRHLKIIKKEG